MIITLDAHGAHHDNFQIHDLGLVHRSTEIFGVIKQMPGQKADEFSASVDCQESTGDPLVYLSMLSQLRMATNGTTLDLLDRTGR